MRFVAQKTVAQQDLLALHRVRARLMKQRIALSNQLRALLNERGVVLRQGAAGLRAGVAALVADERNGEVSGRATRDDFGADDGEARARAAP
jgi:transposase